MIHQENMIWKNKKILHTFKTKHLIHRISIRSITVITQQKSPLQTVLIPYCYNMSSAKHGCSFSVEMEMATAYLVSCRKGIYIA